MTRFEWAAPVVARFKLRMVPFEVRCVLTVTPLINATFTSNFKGHHEVDEVL